MKMRFLHVSLVLLAGEVEEDSERLLTVRIDDDASFWPEVQRALFSRAKRSVMREGVNKPGEI